MRTFRCLLRRSHAYLCLACPQEQHAQVSGRGVGQPTYRHDARRHTYGTTPCACTRSLGSLQDRYRQLSHDGTAGRGWRRRQAEKSFDAPLVAAKGLALSLRILGITQELLRSSTMSQRKAGHLGPSPTSSISATRSGDHFWNLRAQSQLTDKRATCSIVIYKSSYARRRAGSSYARMANEKTSTLLVYRHCLQMCSSGAMYRSVPVLVVKPFACSRSFRWTLHRRFM